MGLGLVSWDISIPAGVRLLVVLLLVVWLEVSDMPIYDGFLDVYMFCMLHVLYMLISHQCGPDYRPPRGRPPSGCIWYFQLLLISNVIS
jgi:hypothetical protein